MRAALDWLDLCGVHRTGSGLARFTALRYTSRAETFAGHPYPNGPLVLEAVVSTLECRAATVPEGTGSGLQF